MNKTIQRYRVNTNRSSDVPQHYYDRLSSLILSALSELHEITLTDLMNLVEREGSAINKELLQWYFLQVKMDLQVKGLINIEFTPNRVQIVKRKRKRSRRELYDSMDS